MKNRKSILNKCFAILMLMVMGFGAMSFSKANAVKVYAFEMGDTLTIEDLINTCRAFPNRSADAWKNESSDLMFVDGSNMLHLKNGQSQYPDVMISITEELSFDGDKNEYYYDVYNDSTKMITCHFNLTDGLLTSIEAEERFWQAKDVCGTYKPQPSIYVVFDGIGGTLNKASTPINGFALYTNEESYLLIREPQVQTSKVIFNAFNFPEEESVSKFGENQIIFDSCYTFDHLEYSLDDMNYTEISEYDFYYEEDDCDCKKFENLTGNIYIKPVLKASHNTTTIDGLDCACETDGYKGAYKCSNCNKYFEDEDGQTLIGDETAYNAWKLGEGKIPATGHTYGSPVWSWSDDYKATATFTCNIDDDTQTVNATVTNVTTDATCTQDGSIVYTAAVEFEGQTYTDTKTAVIDAIGHHYSGEVTYTWNGDRCTASWHCNHEGCNEIESETVIAVYVKDTDATHISNEKGHYEATFENPNFTKQVTEPNSVEKENTMLDGLSSGAVVGISIGSSLLLIIIAYVSMFFYWKKKDKAINFLIPSYKWINKTFFKE